MMREDISLVDGHDTNGDGWLNQVERAEARKTLAERREAAVAEGRGRGGRRGPRTENREPAIPGPKVSTSEVEVFPDASLYDINVVRTIFLNFENDDWEAELQDFNDTDVEVPATMVVDGETYPLVGVRFRGASSYFRVPVGYKRSLNVSIDLVDEDQRLYGYKTLNLLNGSGDASLMSTILYSQIADEHLAVPKANYVKVVINGEYWGVYVNVQQFDKIFTEENFGSSKGTRWKVPGSPRGDGGLAYDGDDLEPYKARYDMKSNDGKKAWHALVDLCRVLNETPLGQLVEELNPILDIDETLWFLAYDITLGNSDGYWSRASDYYIFRDKDGRFHVIPHDINEAFRPIRRRDDGGRAGQPAGGGMSLDPLIGLDNERKPLRSRLLAVPELRERYLKYVKQIAEHSMDWDQLGLQIDRYRSLIDEAVQLDTRKLDSHEAFLNATTIETGEDGNGPSGSLQDFFRRRQSFLLNYEPAEDN